MPMSLMCCTMHHVACNDQCACIHAAYQRQAGKSLTSNDSSVQCPCWWYFVRLQHSLWCLHKVLVTASTGRSRLYQCRVFVIWSELSKPQTLWRKSQLQRQSIQAEFDLERYKQLHLPEVTFRSILHIVLELWLVSRLKVSFAFAHQ